MIKKVKRIVQVVMEGGNSGESSLTSNSSANGLDQHEDANPESQYGNPSGETLTDLNGETDFSRFKKASSCHKLFPSKIWKSLRRNDLDSFYKHVEAVIEDSSETVRNRKRTLIAEEGQNIIPQKKLCLIDKVSSISSGLGEENRIIDVRESPASKSLSKPLKKTTKKKDFPRIPEDCYVAVDCEMVGVGERGSCSVLGRCSIVDYHGNILYDRFVCPSDIITDFRTRWSGIRPKHMKDAECPCKAKRDIQRCLKNKVVIGHSVHNDFKVLHFHPHSYLVRDTFHCNFLVQKANQAATGGQSKSLKNLTKRILGEDIQNRNDGHNSVQDARAALELFKVVRVEWEEKLFQQWQQGGLDVDKFVKSLEDGTSFKDHLGRVVLECKEGSGSSARQCGKSDLSACSVNICKLPCDNLKSGYEDGGGGKTLDGAKGENCNSCEVNSDCECVKYKLLNSSSTSTTTTHGIKQHSKGHANHYRTVSNNNNVVVEERSYESLTKLNNVDYLCDQYWLSSAAE